MRAIACAALAWLAAPSSAHADFEGVLESKLTGSHLSGKARTFVSRDGLRSEMEMELPQEKQATMGKTVRTVTLVKASEPSTTYFLDESRKTYWTVDATRERDGDEDRWTAKKLGKDVVAGFKCDTVLLTSKSGHESEACVTAELGGGSTWLRAMQQQEGNGGLMKALQDAGVKGFPIRWKSKRADEPFSMEVVAAHRQRVPASTFAIPAGYRKTERSMPFASPETSKQLEEAMKDLTPEQRKQMEEMMKGMQKKQ